MPRKSQKPEKDKKSQIVAFKVEDGLLWPYRIVYEYLPGWHPYEDYRQSYAARRELGGGVVSTQIHELDYVHWLFGLPGRVFAVGGTLGSLDVDVEDTASALFEHVKVRQLLRRVH